MEGEGGRKGHGEVRREEKNDEGKKVVKEGMRAEQEKRKI